MVTVSIHIKDGKVLDVAGIPSDVEIVVLDLDDLQEITLTQKDNVQ